MGRKSVEQIRQEEELARLKALDEKRRRQDAKKNKTYNQKHRRLSTVIPNAEADEIIEMAAAAGYPSVSSLIQDLLFSWRDSNK